MGCKRTTETSPSGASYAINETAFRLAAYRPFFKQRLYFDRALMNRIRRFSEIYPHLGSRNLGIAVVREGANSPFHALMTDIIVEYHFTGDCIYLPRFRYEQSEVLSLADMDNSKLQRVSNINPAALAEFRAHYTATPPSAMTTSFYFTYGVLHSQQYRETFANDLAKSAARIPMASDLADFRALCRRRARIGGFACAL